MLGLISILMTAFQLQETIAANTAMVTSTKEAATAASSLKLIMVTFGSFQHDHIAFFQSFCAVTVVNSRRFS